MINDLAGKVEWVRLGGQEVQSGGKLCYAIKRERNMRAVPGSSGDMLFSHVGAGLKPVCISASSTDELKISLRSSDLDFVVTGELADKKMEGAFKIHAKLTPLVEVKMLEIHDASTTILKNIAMFPLGVFGPNIGDVLGPLAGFVQETVGAVFDLKDAIKSPSENARAVRDAFGEKGKASGKVGIIVHFYPMKNSVATDRDRISARDLAKIFF